MYIVYRAYDDNTATILDINTYAQYDMSESDMVKFINKGNNILGVSLSSSKRKISSLSSYEFMQFPMEDEAYQYCRENNISSRNIMYINGIFYVFEKTNMKIHVDYFVCYWEGDIATYIGKNGGYTNYIQSAKSFDKETANKQAAILRNKSKTGKYWGIQRIIVG